MAIPALDSVQGQAVRTISPGDVASKISDGTTPSQFLAIDSTGRITIKAQDGAGNALTSQLNGAQRALDIGINVSGVQIDPRQVGVYNSTLPTLTTGSFAAPELDVNGRTIVVSSNAANFLATVSQGTSPWISSDLADGSVAPGAAGTKSMLAGLVYTSGGIALTTGQQAALQSDSAGNLQVNLKTSIPAGANTIGKVAQDNTVQWVTSDLADGPVAPGTAATKSMLSGGVFNSTLPTLTNGQQAALQMNAAGALIVAVSSTTPGTPINNYFTSTAGVAYGASDTHIYTISSGKTFNIKKMFASAPGRIRVDVQLSTNGTVFNTVFTAYNSTSNPNISIDMDQFFVPDSGAGAAVQILRYNEEPGSTFGISSTFSGTEN